MADNDYPPSAFYFKVAFAATGGMSDTSFQEVSGISATIETEPYSELGENSGAYHLPKSVTYPNLVLKRGIASATSPLVQWCRSVFEGDFASAITPMTVMVYLMNENKVPVRAWSFSNAYPVKWNMESFNSTKNQVAIENIELKYHHSNRLV